MIMLSISVCGEKYAINWFLRCSHTSPNTFIAPLKTRPETNCNFQFLHENNENIQLLPELPRWSCSNHLLHTLHSPFTFQSSASSSNAWTCQSSFKFTCYKLDISLEIEPQRCLWILLYWYRSRYQVCSKDDNHIYGSSAAKCLSRAYIPTWHYLIEIST